MFEKMIADKSGRGGTGGTDPSAGPKYWSLS